MNIYIIGPVTGIPNKNRPKFERVREMLLAGGHQCVSIPHDCIAAGTEWRHAMALSLEHICELVRWNCCDSGIATLDGWENSKGARIEYDLAVALGIPVKSWQEWLE